MRLAVIPGDGIGPEVVAEGLKVLRRGGSRRRDHRRTTSAPRAGSAPASCCPTRCSRSCAQHDAILLGAVGDPSVPPGVLERGLLLRLRFELDHHVNLRPAKLFDGVTQPAGRPRPDRHARASARAPRAPTSATAACCARTPRTRSPPRSRVNTAFGVERVVRYAFERAVGPAAQAPHAGAQDQRAHPRRRPVVAHGRGGRRRVPRRDRRLPARRRGLDVLRHRPGPLRRDRHRQPVRRHPHRPRGRGHRRHRAGRQRQPRRRRAPTRACSSRCTARRPTSPARASPTRPPPCCRSALLLDHLGRTDAGRRGRGRGGVRPLHPRPAGPVRTTDVGDRLAALASG